jgi:hypothetical protein
MNFYSISIDLIADKYNLTINLNIYGIFRMVVQNFIIHYLSKKVAIRIG